MAGLCRTPQFRSTTTNEASALISFDSGSMDHVLDEDWPAVDEAAHEVVQEAKDAFIIEVGSRVEAHHWAARIAHSCRCVQQVREIMYDPESRVGASPHFTSAQDHRIGRLASVEFGDHRRHRIRCLHWRRHRCEMRQLRMLGHRGVFSDRIDGSDVWDGGQREASRNIGW